MKKRTKRVVGYHPTTNRGDQGAVMTPSGINTQRAEPGAALQPEMLANPTPTYDKPRNLGTHYATKVPSIPVMDKRARYKKR